MRAIRFVTVIPLAPILALVLTGCSSGLPSQSGMPTGPTMTSHPAPALPATPTEKARQNALAAYRGMWADFAKAGLTSDWQSPALGQYATGLALSTMSRGLYADHYNALVTKGQAILHPNVSSASPPNDPTTLIVSDCGDSHQFLKYRADNGQLANDGPGGRQAITATVQKQSDGSWKVSDFGIQAVGSC